MTLFQKLTVQLLQIVNKAFFRESGKCKLPSSGRNFLSDIRVSYQVVQPTGERVYRTRYCTYAAFTNRKTIARNTFPTEKIYDAAYRGRNYRLAGGHSFNQGKRGPFIQRSESYRVEG